MSGVGNLLLATLPIRLAYLGAASSSILTRNLINIILCAFLIIFK